MTTTTPPSQPGRTNGDGTEGNSGRDSAIGISRFQESGGFASSLAGLVLAAIPDLDIASWPLIGLGILLSAIGLIRSDAQSRRWLAAAGLILALIAAPVDAATATGALPYENQPATSWDPPSGTTGSGTSNTSAGNTGGYSTSTGISRADAVFLQVLDDHGIDVGDEDGAISIGHSICQTVNRGYSIEQTGQVLVENYDITYHDSAVVIGAAMGAYCPAS